MYHGYACIDTYNSYTMYIIYNTFMCIWMCVSIFSIAVLKSLGKQQLTGERVYFGL